MPRDRLLLTPGAGDDGSLSFHDFTITEHYALFVIGPAILDVNATLTGGSMLSWQPELGTRIALVPRSGDGPVRFAELEPFWVWHFANAYEDGDRVVADFPSWSELSLAAGDRRAASGRRAPVSGRFSRVRIDPARGAATHIGDQPSEFPRIDDRLTGRRHRYLTVGWRSRCRRGKRACTGRGPGCGHVTADHRDGRLVGLAAQLPDHRTGQLDAGDRHAALSEWNGDVAGADGELQRSAVTGESGERSTVGPSTSGENMPVPSVSYRWPAS